jgi:hypothetical protein
MREKAEITHARRRYNPAVIAARKKSILFIAG